MGAPAPVPPSTTSTTTTSNADITESTAAPAPVPPSMTSTTTTSNADITESTASTGTGTSSDAPGIISADTGTSSDAVETSAASQVKEKDTDNISSAHGTFQTTEAPLASADDDEDCNLRGGCADLETSTAVFSGASFVLACGVSILHAAASGL